jgi:hypothetical protein
VSSGNLLCWSTNANSLDDKRFELAARIKLAESEQVAPHVIAITETKFGPASVALLSNYQLFRADRKSANPGGGVCLYVRDNLMAMEVEIEELNSDKVEQIWRVIKTHGDAVLVGCIYRPPSSTIQTNVIINNTITIAKQSLQRLSFSSLLVTDDFDLPQIKYSEIDVGGGSATFGRIEDDANGDKRPAQSFLDCLEENHLSQLITFPK